MKIIIRIILFAPVSIIAFIGVMRLFILWMYDWCIYGGELINYNKKRNVKTIQDVFDKLNNNLNN